MQIKEAQNNDELSEGDLSDNDNDILDNGDDNMLTISVQSDDDDDIYGHSLERPTGVLLPEATNDATNIAPPNEENEDDAHDVLTTANNDDEESDIDKLPLPSGKSIAHHYIDQRKAVFLSLDLEHGGDWVGLLQLSVETFCMIPDANGTSFTAVREQHTFNEYVQPGPDALWNDAINTHSHGLHQMRTPRGKKYYIQCTTWCDKKQVTFLHTAAVGNSRSKTVNRHTKGRRGHGRAEFAAPQLQETYVENFNAVDRND